MSIPVVVQESATGQVGRGLIARTLRQPRAYISLGWLVLLIIASIVLPMTGLLDPLSQNATAILQTPSGAHWLGTDELGRDVLSRIVYGAPDALLLSLEVVVVSVLIGAPLGLWAGFGSRWGDWISSRFADLVLAIPGIIILLAVVTIAGNNMPIAMVVFGVLVSAGNIRLVRASTKAVVEELYVDAARVSGLSPVRIAVKHVLPNVAGPLVVQSSIIAGISLLVLTGLQFLGLGPNPPAPSWGALVSEASADISRQPWLMVPSGLVVIFTVLAFNQFGDALRDSIGGPGRSNLLAAARNYVAVKGRPGSAAIASDERDALVVEGVTVTTNRGGTDVKLVDGVSFRLAKGETLGIVGESGCGKSMTALAILGLLPSSVAFTAGSVIVGGEDLARLSERDRRKTRGSRIAAIPQEPMTALDPNFTIGKQLVAPIRRLRGLTGGEAKAEAIRLLDSVGIVSPEAVYRSYPHEISGGMAQRVCIAQALIGQPDVLIADEPTTALDVTVQAEILDLLRKLQHEFGMAIVLVTHNLGVAADICDRTLVMYAGQIVESASIRELLRTPRHPYTKALLGSVPAKTSRGNSLPTIRGSVPRPESWPVSCRFADRCPLAVDACRQQPIELMTAGRDRESRCIRIDDLRSEAESSRNEETGVLSRK